MEQPEKTLKRVIRTYFIGFCVQVDFSYTLQKPKCVIITHPIRLRRNKFFPIITHPFRPKSRNDLGMLLTNINTSSMLKIVHPDYTLSRVG